MTTHKTRITVGTRRAPWRGAGSSSRQYQAVCSCGWQGHWWESRNAADDDEVEHLIESGDVVLVPLEHLRAAKWAKEPHPPLVKTIADGFDPRLLGVLTVSKRSATEFIVIDGRVRWEALLQLGESEAPCFVLEGLTEKREAKIRMEFSRQRQPIRERT